MIRISGAGLAAASAVAALSLVFATGCTTKNYVRSQTEPVIQKTNELDDATAANNRAIHDVDTRSQQGIQNAQNSANQAQQNAQNATQAASTAQQSAQDAVNRADSLAGVIAGLDNYKQVGDVSVTFGFNKSVLTKGDLAQLDQFGGQLAGTQSYILEVTGGTDSVGSKEYNYALSDRRAMAVVQYLAAKYNVPAHKFYLVGLGKDVEIDSNKTAAGRAKNRHVEVQLLSNSGQNQPAQTGMATPPSTGGGPSEQ
ncbi:MAG TPA: OmpA family protein [Acidobacteriaceae bacterium]|jgi:outer membrane protein OmpA-like peptidoglycan-associated protein|nr:OmpA family protein [Acidobacteriaceae bacterium]